MSLLEKSNFAISLCNLFLKLVLVYLSCGYDQLPGSSDHPLDGVLGLGRGKSSIVSQLRNQGFVKNVIGHCLSGQGGFLFFGEDVYESSRMTWTSMSREDT